MVRLLVRHRQRDPPLRDPRGGAAVPARLRGRRPARARPAVPREDRPRRRVTAEARGGRPAPGRQLAVGPGVVRPLGDARRAVRPEGGGRRAAKDPAPPPRGWDVECPGPARRPVAVAAVGDLAADPGRERDDRAGRRDRRPRGEPCSDPPRRLGRDLARRPPWDADPVRGEGQGRSLRVGGAHRDDRPRHRADQPRGRPAPAGDLVDPGRAAAGRRAAGVPEARARRGRGRRDPPLARSRPEGRRAAPLRCQRPAPRRRLAVRAAAVPDQRPVGVRGAPRRRGDGRVGRGTQRADGHAAPRGRSGWPTRSGCRSTWGSR